MKNKSDYQKAMEYLNEYSFKGERWISIKDEKIQNDSIWVSSMGRVFSAISCTFLRQYGFDNTKPYVYLNAYGETPYTVAVEELVATCFLDKPKVNYKQFLDHIDGDITNNKATNLRWMSIEQMKQLRDDSYVTNDSINSLRNKLLDSNNECESWMDGYWKLYFKYVPKEKQTVNEEEFKKTRSGITSPGMLLPFMVRDFDAEDAE